MERQTKDGSVYKQIGPDEWEMVTRKTKDGATYRKVGADDWELLAAPPAQPQQEGRQGQAFVEGFGKSASLGLLPYAQAGVEMAVDKVAGFDDDRSYKERVHAFKERSGELKEQHPGYSMAGELTGFVVPGMGAAKIVKSAKGALGIKQAADASRLAKLAGKSGTLAAEGALIGAAYTPEGDDPINIPERLKAAGTGAAFGAAIPPAFAVAGKTLKGMAKAPVWAGKKLLAAAGGVKEEVIERYLKDPARIRGAKTFDELYDQVTGIVRKLGDDLETEKMNYDAAKAHLDDVADGIKNSRVEGKEKALEQVQQARAALDSAFNVQKQVLQQRASPTQIEPMVEDALGNLRQKVSKGSGEAYEILENQEGFVDLGKVVERLIPIRKSLNVAGKGPATPQAAGAQKAIDDLVSMVGKLPARLPLTEAKKLIQQIDQAEKVIYDSGAFTNEVSAAFKAIRQGVDEQLKQIPEYAQKMATVADDTAVYGQARQRFGQDTSRLSRLQGIGRTTARADREVLQKLAAKEGGDLPGSVDRMVEAQRTLKSPVRLENIKQKLPETGAVRSAEMQAAAAKRLAKPKLVKEAIKKSAANFKAQSAKAKLEKQKELFNKFRSFGEQTAESRLKQVGFGRRHATKVLSELSEYADEDFVEAVKAAQDAAAFDKTMFHGSRNVNLWSVLGAIGSSAVGRGGAGAAFGGVLGGPVGIALGAVTGAMMDVYGPKLTKQILDGVIKIKGPITSGKLAGLKIPENAKKDLIATFQRTVLAEKAASAHEAVKLVADSDKPKKGPDKWAADGMAKIEAYRPDYKKQREQMLKNPKLKSLLIRASDLKPGSKAFDQLMKQLDEKIKGRDPAGGK